MCQNHFTCFLMLSITGICNHLSWMYNQLIWLFSFVIALRAFPYVLRSQFHQPSKIRGWVISGLSSARTGQVNKCSNPHLNKSIRVYWLIVPVRCWFISRRIYYVVFFTGHLNLHTNLSETRGWKHWCWLQGTNSIAPAMDPCSLSAQGSVISIWYLILAHYILELFMNA